MGTTLQDVRLIKPGDFVCLTDDQTIQDMMDSRMQVATDGLMLEVENVMHVHEQQGLCDWYLCPLLGTYPENYPKLWLLAKAVEHEIEVRVYWVPDEFQAPRTRGDLIRDGVLWLFEEPLDTSTFKPCDLAFTRWIDHDTGKGVTKFDMKGGALHGEFRNKPASTEDWQQVQPATVVEYSTDQAGVGDPEALVLEVGGLNEYGEQIPEGGFVQFFLGGPVVSNDIDLIQDKPHLQE